MKKKTHSIDVLFMMVLFAIFAVMSVLIILIGSNVYSKINNSRETNGNNRNVLSYVTNKIRTSQAEDGIYIEEKDGVKVLVIESSSDDDGYETLIFFENGSLKEATIAKGDEYNLDFGDVIADVSYFDVKMDNVTGIISLTVASDGENISVDVYSGMDR